MLVARRVDSFRWARGCVHDIEDRPRPRRSVGRGSSWRGSPGSLVYALVNEVGGGRYCCRCCGNSGPAQVEVVSRRMARGGEDLVSAEI